MSLISKTFLVGIPTDSEVAFLVKSVEEFLPSPFFTIEKILRMTYSVMRSPEGLCGVNIKVKIDGRPKFFKFKAPNAPRQLLGTLSLKFSRNEHLLKLLAGSDDTGIQAVKVYTTHQKAKLGNVYSYEHLAEIDETMTERAIIGFHLMFNDKILVELSVYTAPLLKNRTSFIVPLTSKRSGMRSSFNPLPHSDDQHINRVSKNKSY